MKRILVLMVAATMICISLVSCGKPDSISDEMYSIGEAALQVADDYIAYKIDYDTASNKLDTLSNDAQIVYDRNKDTAYSSGDLMVKIHINNISVAMITANYKGVPSDIKGKRDILANCLKK